MQETAILHQMLLVKESVCFQELFVVCGFYISKCVFVCNFDIKNVFSGFLYF